LTFILRQLRARLARLTSIHSGFKHPFDVTVELFLANLQAFRGFCVAWSGMDVALASTYVPCMKGFLGPTNRSPDKDQT